MKLSLGFIAAIVLLISCKQYEKAPSGMRYIITHVSENEKNIQHGEFVKFNVEYKLKSNDSILRSTYDTFPLYFPVDSLQLGSYTLTEIFLQCKKGDKIEFLVNISGIKESDINYSSIIKNRKKQLIKGFKYKNIISNINI